MRKGLDQKFLHYGIRQDDLELIKSLCEKHGLDSDWLCEDILRQYHSRKVDAIEINDTEVESVIDEAIQKIKK